MTFSENFACPEHGVSLAELEPRIFSFNSPHGACPRCTGLGAQLEIDPDLLVPDTSLSIEEGALVPWTIGSQSFYDSVIEAVADRYEISLDTPWRDLKPEEQDRFLYGTGGDKVFVTYRNRMGRKRKVHTPAFKAQVALAALRGAQTINELASQYGIHSTLIHGWKKQLLAGAGAVFAAGAKTTGPPEDKTAELYEQIGRLKVELDWVKKKSAALG